MIPREFPDGHAGLVNTTHADGIVEVYTDARINGKVQSNLSTKQMGELESQNNEICQSHRGSPSSKQKFCLVTRPVLGAQ
jgi:hypothetical protein